MQPLSAKRLTASLLLAACLQLMALERVAASCGDYLHVGATTLGAGSRNNPLLWRPVPKLTVAQLTTSPRASAEDADTEPASPCAHGQCDRHPPAPGPSSPTATTVQPERWLAGVQRVYTSLSPHSPLDADSVGAPRSGHPDRVERPPQRV